MLTEIKDEPLRPLPRKYLPRSNCSEVKIASNYKVKRID